MHLFQQRIFFLGWVGARTRLASRRCQRHHHHAYPNVSFPVYGHVHSDAQNILYIWKRVSELVICSFFSVTGREGNEHLLSFERNLSSFSWVEPNGETVLCGNTLIKSKHRCSSRPLIFLVKLKEENVSFLVSSPCYMVALWWLYVVSEAEEETRQCMCMRW